MLIAAQFMTSAFVPFAYAAEATTAAPTPAPYTEDEQKPTDSDNEILKKVSDINGVADLKKNFDNAMNGNASGNGATSDGTDIGDANAAVAQQSQQKREANLKEKKDQKVPNEDTTITVYLVPEGFTFIDDDPTPLGINNATLGSGEIIE